MASILDSGVTRRGFLQGMAGILAAGVAPAAIGSNILMPVKTLWKPETGLLWGQTGHFEGVRVIEGYDLGRPGYDYSAWVRFKWDEKTGALEMVDWSPK